MGDFTSHEQPGGESYYGVTIPIDEASVKIRTGGPVDDEEDYSLPIWAGVIPIAQSVGTPVPDDNNLPDVIEPSHARNFNFG